jgi:hypothetical protein
MTELPGAVSCSHENAFPRPPPDPAAARAVVRVDRARQLLGGDRAAGHGRRPRRQHRAERVGAEPVRADPGGRHSRARPGRRPGRDPGAARLGGLAHGSRRGARGTCPELRAAARGPAVAGRRRRSGAHPRRGHHHRPVHRRAPRDRSDPDGRCRRRAVLPRPADRWWHRRLARLARGDCDPRPRPAAAAAALARAAHRGHRRPSGHRGSAVRRRYCGRAGAADPVAVDGRGGRRGGRRTAAARRAGRRDAGPAAAGRVPAGLRGPERRRAGWCCCPAR